MLLILLKPLLILVRFFHIPNIKIINRIPLWLNVFTKLIEEKYL
jgi:hypothetical protein